MASPYTVSEEMVVRAVKLCRQYMGDSWAEIERADLEVDRVKGGLSNEMYKCTLSEKITTKPGEPREVLLRIYGQILSENPETVVTDSVTYGLLAEKKMGPKLYGIFTGGRVEEYVKSHTLFAKDLHRSCISLATAEIMAGFHRLRMPLMKEPHWLFETTTRYLDDGLNNLSLSSIKDKSVQLKLQKVFSYGLTSEYEVLKKILAQVDSPVVFCHNDLQEGNILYKESPNSPQGWKLVPIDFEYSSYNYRGYDIANHFCEWMYEYHVDKPPYFRAIIEDYPDKDQQRAFCERYLQKMHATSDGQISNKEFERELKELMLEVDAFRLMSHFFWGIWSVVQSQISDIHFGYLDYALVRFEHYYVQKKELLDSSELKID